MLAARQPGETPDGEAYDALGLANRNEATLALARAFFEDGALIYDARGLTPLRLAPASLAPTSEVTINADHARDVGRHDSSAYATQE